MNTALLAALVAIFCALIAIFAANRGGPKVTTIETRREDRGTVTETRRDIDGQGE